MKTLILMRHGKSFWDNPEQDDLLRPLNQKGQVDSENMALWLKKSLKYQPDVFLCSDALRTTETLDIVLKTNSWDPKRAVYDPDLYHAKAKVMIDKVHPFLQDYQTIMMVGHNPGITDFVNLYSNANIDNVPTGGIFILKHYSKNRFDVIDYIYPKFL